VRGVTGRLQYILYIVSRSHRPGKGAQRHGTGTWRRRIVWLGGWLGGYCHWARKAAALGEGGGGYPV
jgi:hypothetical protein